MTQDSNVNDDDENYVNSENTQEKLTWASVFWQIAYIGFPAFIC
jgi:hypothetical protein